MKLEFVRFEFVNFNLAKKEMKLIRYVFLVFRTCSWRPVVALHTLCGLKSFCHLISCCSLLQIGMTTLMPCVWWYDFVFPHLYCMCCRVWYSGTRWLRRLTHLSIRWICFWIGRSFSSGFRITVISEVRPRTGCSQDHCNAQNTHRPLVPTSLWKTGEICSHQLCFSVPNVLCVP